MLLIFLGCRKTKIGLHGCKEAHTHHFKALTYYPGCSNSSCAIQMELSHLIISSWNIRAYWCSWILRALGQNTNAVVRNLGLKAWTVPPVIHLMNTKWNRQTLVKHLLKIFSLLTAIKDDTECHNYNSTSETKEESGIWLYAYSYRICRESEGLWQMGPPLEWGTACTVMNVKWDMGDRVWHG